MMRALSRSFLDSPEQSIYQVRYRKRDCGNDKQDRGTSSMNWAPEVFCVAAAACLRRQIHFQSIVHV